ncbi:MAG: lysophospholipid acyltransferase family protein [Alphaproteobacteria bacterium]|nr:lysophospholipid acyltransferase family protein [Alphaproteobacteria bacterium]
MKLTFLKDFINSPIGEKIIGNLAYYYLKFVGLTTRWQSVTGVKETYETLDKYGSMIVIGWHGRTLIMPYFWNKTRPLNALVSPHRDGRIIVHILAKFGIGNINGSSDRNSKEAAIELMRNLQQGNSIAIIPDGPRGPSMKLTLSPLFYARKSGKPIMGITYSIAGSKIITRSWDNMLIPLPFHKGMYAITEPVFIPENTTDEELEIYRQKIEQTLNELTWKLDKEMGLPFIAQGKEAKKSRKTNNENEGK